MKRILHKENCQNLVRKVFTTKHGNKISLLGKYGFEWSVGIEKRQKEGKCFLTVVTFPSRIEAQNHYNLLIKTL